MAHKELIWSFVFYRKDEVPPDSPIEKWMAASWEVYSWAQTLVPSQCLGLIYDYDGHSARLIFQDEKSCARVNAEYQDALLWKDVE